MTQSNERWKYCGVWFSKATSFVGSEKKKDVTWESCTSLENAGCATWKEKPKPKNKPQACETGGGVCAIQPGTKRDELADGDGSLQIPPAAWLVI